MMILGVNLHIKREISKRRGHPMDGFFAGVHVL